MENGQDGDAVQNQAQEGLQDRDSSSTSSSDRGDDNEYSWLRSELQPVWVDPTEGQTLTRLLEAAEDGDVERMLEVLPQLHMSLDTPGEDGDTAMHLAALYGHLEAVQLLMRSGASVNVLDEDGSTPLHDAAAGGYLEIVQAIVERSPGAVEATDSDGDSPLHHAARGGWAAVAAYLLQLGADAGLKNKQSKTPLEVVDEGDEEVRRVLQGAFQIQDGAAAGPTGAAGEAGEAGDGQQQ